MRAIIIPTCRVVAWTKTMPRKAKQSSWGFFFHLLFSCFVFVSWAAYTCTYIHMYMRSMAHVSHQSGSLGEHPASRGAASLELSHLPNFCVEWLYLSPRNKHEQKAIGNGRETLKCSISASWQRIQKHLSHISCWTSPVKTDAPKENCMQFEYLVNTSYLIWIWTGECNVNNSTVFFTVVYYRIYTTFPRRAKLQLVLACNTSTFGFLNGRPQS